MNHITQISLISNPVRAFEAFNISPYKWREIVNEDLLKKYRFDLCQVAVNAYQTVICNDVLTIISETSAYRFFTSGDLRTSMSLGNGTRVVFREYWKSKAVAYNPFYSIQLSSVNNYCLALYQDKRTDSLVYVLDHDDEALVWISETIIPKPDFGVEHYSHLFSDSLIQAGCPVDSLQYLKLQKIDDFKKHFKGDFEDPADYFELHEYHFVMFWHEDGVIYQTIGFNTDEEFENACEYIVKSMLESFLQQAVGGS